MLGNGHKVPILRAPSQRQEDSNEDGRKHLGRLQKLQHQRHLRLPAARTSLVLIRWLGMKCWLTGNSL